MRTLLFSLLVCGFAASEKPRTAFIGLGERRGEVEPCGCPKVQLGGLQRLVAFVDERRRKAPGLSVLDTGNTFFSLPQFPESRKKEEIRKANLIAEAYRMLGVQAMVPGPRDVASGKDELGRLVKASGVTLVAANLVDEKGAFLFAKAHTFAQNGLQIGVTGAVAEGASMGEWKTLPAKETLAAAFSLIRDSDIRVALLQDPEMESAARQIGFDIVLVPPQEGGKAIFFGDWKTAERSWGEHGEFELDPKWDKKSRFTPVYRRYLSAIRSAAVNADAPAKKIAGKRFVANAFACKQCHEKQYDFWANTKHASAYLVLYAKDQNFNPECIVCHSVGYKEPGGFSDIASPIVLKGQPQRKKGETPFVENWMKEIFASDPGKGPLDSRTEPKRYAELKKRYHATLDRLAKDGKIQALHMGVQCEHCHGNRAGHPGTGFKTVGKVQASSCTTCHRPPHDEAFGFQKRVAEVACPLMAK